MKELRRIFQGRKEEETETSSNWLCACLQEVY